MGPFSAAFRHEQRLDQLRRGQAGFAHQGADEFGAAQAARAGMGEGGGHRQELAGETAQL